MNTPASEARAGASSPMTPERWRAVDAILQGALACDASQRDAFVIDACAGDEALQREVASLLAAHDQAGDAFLERPGPESLGMPAPLPERLAKALAGRYAVEHEIAHGGMATVYLARDLRHERRVAIKVLREELAAAVGAERFLAEIRVTASLQHPHILPLFDSGNADGVLWYVMPFIDGETLRTRLSREGRLPVDVALQVAREMADALEHAHSHGVVHRDVKPENVLLQGGHALVADFGIALALEHAGGDRLTRTGIRIGTPQYMAPEQAAGERAIDARTDVYALGAVLHEMLAGSSPLSAPPRAVLQRVMDEDPSGAVDTASLLDAAVRKALARRPEDRFPSAASFAAALVAPPPAAPAAGTGTTPDDGQSSSGREEGASTSRGRVVSARAAMYAAGAMLIVGLVGGWFLARSPVGERWASTAPASPGPTVDGASGPAAEGDLSLTVFDRSGRALRAINANRPWTPRISRDGRRVAYGAFGDGRSTSDLWVVDLEGGAARRLTNDGGDSNDPQWSADGASLAFSAHASGGKDIFELPVNGGEARLLAQRNGTQFASDWRRDGSALLVTEETDGNRRDILVQPVDGSPAWPYLATAADETAGRVSPDGKWVAYTSDESGRAEVYLDSWPKPRQRVVISSGGGVHPVWSGDGQELYYWNDVALMVVPLGEATGDWPPRLGARSVLFKARYTVGPNTMYDVSPDGRRFVVVQER